MWNNEKQQKVVFPYVDLQTYYHFQLDFQIMDQHTGGQWLIHGTKHRKDNQLQSLELPCRIPMISVDSDTWLHQLVMRTMLKFLQNQSFPHQICEMAYFFPEVFIVYYIVHC